MLLLHLHTANEESDWRCQLVQGRTHCEAEDGYQMVLPGMQIRASSGHQCIQTIFLLFPNSRSQFPKWINGVHRERITMNKRIFPLPSKFSSQFHENSTGIKYQLLAVVDKSQQNMHSADFESIQCALALIMVLSRQIPRTHWRYSLCKWVRRNWMRAPFGSLIAMVGGLNIEHMVCTTESIRIYIWLDSAVICSIRI